MADEWRPAPGFPGYEVSLDGRVRSWRKSLTEPYYKTPKKEKVGRQLYYLVQNGRYRGVYGHKLAEEAFGASRKEYLQSQPFRLEQEPDSGLPLLIFDDGERRGQLVDFSGQELVDWLNRIWREVKQNDS